jgi:hypothetical protein
MPPPSRTACATRHVPHSPKSSNAKLTITPPVIDSLDGRPIEQKNGELER